MKKILIFAIMILIITGSVLYIYNAPPVEVKCYLYDYCGGCGSSGNCGTCMVEAKFRKKYTNLIKSAGFEDIVDFKLHNTAYYGAGTLNNILAKNQLAENTELPIIQIGETILIADEIIEFELIDTITQNFTVAQKIKKWFKVDLNNEQPHDTVNEILYFSMKGCPDCIITDTYFDELSDALDINVRTNITTIYLGGDAPPENRAMLQEMYNLYDRADEDLWVPSIFINEECLIDNDEIKEFFDTYSFDENIETKVIIGYE